MEQLTQGCNGREYCRQECFELGWRCVQVGVQSGIKARWVGVWAWSRNIVPTAVPPTGPRTGAERGSLEAGTEDGHGGVGRGVCRVRRIMSKGAPPPFPRRRLSSATASPLNSPLPSPAVLSPSPLLVSPPITRPQPGLRLCSSPRLPRSGHDGLQVLLVSAAGSRRSSLPSPPTAPRRIARGPRC